jgi:hypothetical protein
MEQTGSRNRWKEIGIAVLALTLLALLVWLFLRPWEPARRIVFGDLGRREIPSNAVAGGPVEAAPEPPGSVVSNGVPEGAIIPRTNQPGHELSGQNARGLESAPTGHGGAVGNAGPISAGTGLSNSQAAENGGPLSPSPSPSGAVSNSVRPPSPRALPPLASYSSPKASRPRFVPDVDTWPQDPANKDTTAKLLAEAKAADMARVNPIPARTADLLGHDNQPWRWLDPEAGSNVVFILDNSFSMLTNGKSLFARHEVLRTVESMNAGSLFYVLFFHTGGYEGMPSLAPLPASPENIQAMTNWLFSVGHRAGADPAKAILRALGLSPAPDTVWLLSGSELPDNVIDNVREANASLHAHINTVGLYTRDGEEALRRIADENRGVYRFIPPPNASPP